MCAVVVVLPPSIWAIMVILRMFSTLNDMGIPLELLTAETALTVDRPAAERRHILASGASHWDAAQKIMKPRRGDIGPSLCRPSGAVSPPCRRPLRPPPQP